MTHEESLEREDISAVATPVAADADEALAPRSSEEPAAVQTTSYTIVEDLAETIVDLDARYVDARRPQATAVAYAVAAVDDWNPSTATADSAVAAADSADSADTTTGLTPSPATHSSASAVPVGAVYATPCDAPQTRQQTHATDTNLGNLAVATTPSCSNSYYPHLEQDEEEKEEITGLAGLPTAGVYCAPATVIHNNDDDEELARMKRAAAMRSDDDSLLVPDKEPQPEPLPGEDFADFYTRTIDHWNVLAAERLTGSGSDLTLDTLEDESTRMASQRWQEMQPINNAEATVVAISEDDVHPSDLQAIQAELVGQRFGNNLSTDTTSTTATAFHQHGALAATAVTDSQDDTATEATVIDSAPLAKEEGREAWQAAEEAQVLESVASSEVEQELEQERKPPASDSGNERDHVTCPQRIPPSYRSNIDNNNYHQSEDDYAVADQEGLVLAIEDDVHPSDFAGDDAAAQVVGADFGYAVADQEGIATTTTTSSGAAVTAAVDHTIDSPTEVEAVLVQGGDSTSSSRAIATATTAVASAATVIEESQTVSVLPTESITVEQESDEAPPPTKEVPWSGPPSGRQDSAGDTSLGDEESPDEFEDTPPPPPCRESFGNGAREQSAASGTSERSSASSQRSQLQNLSSNIARSTGNVMDALFGDTKGPFVGRKVRASESDISGSVTPRTLLPWSVIFSTANKMWVATLQTSQKALDSNDITEASKALRAFSLPTEMQAISLARAWTPPRMMAFSDHPACHICKSKFAVFRRACHCRNCGVCVCKDCTVQWPSNMVPDTYNTKDEVCVNACKSCDWISNAFRLALLNGNMDEAVAIHATANINVTCPFSNVKGELFYPVHCAVLGGSLQLLKWLVDEQCCPIKSVRVSGKSRESAGRYTPIVTSKGRSLLGIAMENCYVNIVRYLVVKKGIVIAGERDITHEMLTRNLTKILRILPDESCSANDADDILGHESSEFAAAGTSYELMSPSPSIPDPDDNVRSLSDGARDFGAIYQHRDAQAWGAGETADECIICFDGKIDCVATPCGHQICCLKCSKNVTRCPVCAQDCSFLRVFKP